jgi:hypothetical protein
MRKELARIRADLVAGRKKETPLLERLRADPAQILRLAGMTPDPWQQTLLRSSPDRVLMLCSRQAGKSQTAAALALRAALLEPPALVLLLSPSLRQSGELFRDKLLPLWRNLGSPAKAKPPTQLTLELAGGSRVVSLPGDEETIRCFSGVRLLVIDEAARVTDALYRSVRPMLAVSRGRLVALSTPFGRQGWFWETWFSQERWDRVRIEAKDCPRITKEFLAEERVALGARWFRQEYECSFEDIVDAVFAYDDIMATRADDVRPLFPAGV